MTRSALTAMAAALSVALVGCTAPAPLPTPTPTPTATVAPTGDGVLRLGTLFPMSGDVAYIGPGMVAAVEIAVRDINAAGGVLGEPVEVLARDSGDASEQKLEAAFAELVDRGIDVVIGPATSALAERLLPLAADAGVVVISPAATYPIAREAEGPSMLVRTIPAYDAQAAAIVRALAAEGAESVALVTTGDALGFAVELAVRAAAEEEGVRLQSIEQLDAATNVDRLAFSVSGGEPEAVILATGTPLAAQNQAVIAALADRGIEGERLWLTAQNLADYSATVEAGLLEGANGVLEGAAVSEELATRLRQSDPALISFRFAPETYDAVVLAALAAVLADDDGGASIAAQLASAASQGVPCASFGECIEVLETEPAIDYDGLSGPLTLDALGDLVEGELGLYRYTAENRPELVGALSLTAR